MWNFGRLPLPILKQKEQRGIDVAGLLAKHPGYQTQFLTLHLYTNCCFGDVALYQQGKGRSVSCTPGTVGTVYFVDVLVIFPASRTSDKLMN